MSLEDMFSVPDTSLFRGGPGKKKSQRGSTPKGASVAMQKAWQGFSRDEKWNLRLKNKDSDMDGIPDPWDCQPMNPLRQDTYTPAQLEEINKLGKISVGGYISNGAFGTVYDIKSSDPAMQHIADKYVVKVSNVARREADDYSDPDALSKKDKQVLGYAKVYEQRYGKKPALEHLSRKFGLFHNFSTHDEIKAYKEQGMEELTLISPQKPMMVDVGPFQTLGMLKPKVDVFAEHGVKHGKEHLITPEIMEQMRKGTQQFTAKDFHIWDSYQVGVAKDPEGEERVWIFDTDVIAPANENQWNIREKGGSVAAANEYVWDDFKRKVRNRSGMTNIPLIKSQLGGPKGRQGWIKEAEPMNKEYVQMHRFYEDGKENGYIGIWMVGQSKYDITACYRPNKNGPLESTKVRFDKDYVLVLGIYEKLMKNEHISQAFNELESYKSTSERQERAMGLNEIFANDPQGLLDSSSPQGVWLDKNGIDNPRLIIRREYWHENRPKAFALLKRDINDKLVIRIGEFDNSNDLEWEPKDPSLAKDEAHMKTIFSQVVSGDVKHGMAVVQLMIDNDKPNQLPGEWRFVEHPPLDDALDYYRYFIEDVAQGFMYIKKHGRNDYTIRLMMHNSSTVQHRFRKPLKDVRRLFMAFIKLEPSAVAVELRKLGEESSMPDSTTNSNNAKPRWIRYQNVKAPVLIKRNCVVNRKRVGFCVLSRKDDGTMLIATTNLNHGASAPAQSVSWDPKDVSLARDEDRMKMLFEQVSQGTIEDSQEMLRNLKRNDQTPAKKEGWEKDPHPMGQWEQKQLWFENGQEVGLVGLGENMAGDKNINVIRRGDSQNESFRGYWQPGQSIQNDSGRMQAAFDGFMKGDLNDAIGNIKLIQNAKKRKQEREQAEQEAARSTGKPMMEKGLAKLFPSGPATPGPSRGVVSRILSGPWDAQGESSKQRWSSSGLSLASFPPMPTPALTPATTPSRSYTKAAGWVKKGSNSHEWRNGKGKVLGTIFVTGLEVRLLNHQQNVMYSTGEWVSASEAQGVYQEMLQYTLVELISNRKKHDFTEIVGVGN